MRTDASRFTFFAAYSSSIARQLSCHLSARRTVCSSSAYSVRARVCARACVRVCVRACVCVCVCARARCVAVNRCTSRTGLSAERDARLGCAWATAGLCISPTAMGARAAELVRRRRRAEVRGTGAGGRVSTWQYCGNSMYAKTTWEGGRVRERQGRPCHADARVQRGMSLMRRTSPRACGSHSPERRPSTQGNV